RIVVAVLFFTSMCSRLSIPTLFPYTTLFRSREALRADVARYAAPAGAPSPDYTAFVDGAAFQASGKAAAAAAAEAAVLEVISNSDRKSTRLNSSHVKNSYAVSCFKKKNTLDR